MSAYPPILKIRVFSTQWLRAQWMRLVYDLFVCTFGQGWLEMPRP